jgi:hypothetical protein
MLLEKKTTDDLKREIEEIQEMQLDMIPPIAWERLAQALANEQAENCEVYEDVYLNRAVSATIAWLESKAKE